MNVPFSPPTSSPLGLPPLPTPLTSSASNPAGPELELLVPTEPPTPALETAVIIPTTSFITSLDASTMPVRAVSPVPVPLSSKEKVEALSSALASPEKLDPFIQLDTLDMAAAVQLIGSYQHQSTATANLDTPFKRPLQPPCSPALLTPKHPLGNLIDPSAPEIDESTSPRLSAQQKGKGRAVTPVEVAYQPSQRIKKKPKIFGDYDVEIPAVGLDEDGDGINGHNTREEAVSTPRATSIDSEFIKPKIKPRISHPTKPPPHHLSHDPTHPSSLPSISTHSRQPPTKSKPRISKPPTPTEAAYQSRLTLNALKPSLYDMKGPCPAWSSTRKALQVAAEYLTNPRSTGGGSVDIGAGGIARGVILEGQARAGGFWGQGQEAGTIITSLGRPRKAMSIGPGTATLPEHQPPPAGQGIEPTMTPFDELSTGTRPSEGANMEEPTIAALILAQRARTPVAIAVTNDYSLAPFRVPRPFVVLGWFWVVDAWVKAVDKPVDQISNGGPRVDRFNDVVWMFRFDWCEGSQASPWWISRSAPDRPRQTGQGTPVRPLSNQWPVKGPSVGGPSTIRSPDSLSQDVEVGASGQVCAHCRYWSARVYSECWSCLNEGCTMFPGNQSSLSAFGRTPCKLRSEVRISPEWLGLQLRPPEPTGQDSSSNYQLAGKGYWKGWVCKECGAANERRRWEGWDCEACDYHIRPTRRIFSDEYLRPPLRPVCTGPRQEDGHARFVRQGTKSWSLFRDHIKVVRHGLMGDSGTEHGNIYQALNTEAGDVHLAARSILRGLQAQGQGEVAFRRHVMAVANQRASEREICPFYTYLCGPDPVPVIPNFPTSTATPWTASPIVCLDAADLLNERAGRMFPGEKERFNSVLFVAVPPQLYSLQPEMVVESDSMVGLLLLGADCEIRIKDERKKVKIGDMTAQHGDVIGINAGTGSIRITVKFDGLGLLCIGRQVYVDPTKPAPVQIRQSPTPTLLKPNAKPRKSINGTPRPANIVDVDMPLIPSVPPLKDWYIGPWPMDPDQALCVFPPMRELPASETIGPPPESADIDPASTSKDVNEGSVPPVPRRYTGIEVFAGKLSSPKILAPPPFESFAKRKKVADLEGQADTPKAIKTKKPRTSKAAAADLLDIAGSSPVASAKKAAGGGAKANGKSGKIINARKSSAQAEEVAVQ